MIFPILNGIFSVIRAPVTWAIFCINLVVFAWTHEPSENSQNKLESLLGDEVFSRMQGMVFARFIQSHQERYPASMQFLAKQSLSGDTGDRKRLLAGMAMRDSYFISEAKRYQMSGDQVGVKWWREKFIQVEETKDIHPSYTLGVTQDESGVSRWFTYQFAHSGFSHLVGNMLFFLIFASCLEAIVGSLGLLTVYLLAGVFAAVMFLAMNEASAIPLIGASGAVSGIMAFFCVLLWDRNVRYVFFLLIPKRGFAGIVYLPAWVTLILWFLSDLAGHWSTPAEFGGIAYSAHLGGELCGALCAVILLLYRRWQGKPLLPEALPVDTKPVFTRYV